MPVFQPFTTSTEARFTIVAVNDGESEADVRVCGQYAWSGLAGSDVRATDWAFKAPNLPTSYVIDRGGTVRLMWIGAISEANLEKYVTSLIKE
jgi:hypothetical protein